MKKLKRSQFVGMNQHYKRFRYEEYLESMVRCEIESLEMWCGAPHFMLDSEHYSNPQKYLQLANEYGLKYVSLCAPSMMWQYHYGIPGKERERKAVGYYCNGVRAAAELGCKVMSVNAGWGYWDEDPEESVKRSVDMVSQVADIAQELGIVLALETLQPMEANIVLTLQQASDYWHMIDHPAVKLMTDVVAVSVAGESVAQWFDAFGSNLVHCHLIDGSPSGHKVQGDGELPLASILRTFEENDYTGYLTMELMESIDPFNAEKRNISVINRFL